jgi:sugar/nucleoside kinase (ribokinase family)
MSQPKLLVVGELNIDLILNHIQGFPSLGTEILAGEMNFTMGSSSAIFACNISALGISTSFCGRLGQDLFAAVILEEFKKKDVDVAYVKTSKKSKTGITLVLNYSNDRANVTYGGAMNEFSIMDIPVSSLYQFHHLHLSSYFLQKKLQKDIPKLFREAKRQGLTTSLDLQWDPEDKWEFPYAEVLPFVDVFLPNESEILRLSGQSELNKALEKIGVHGNKIVVKRGVEGALCYEKGQLVRYKPFLHNRFVDAIGAGDSFNAGFISQFIQGASLEKSMQFGNLAGAINTTAVGGTAAFTSLAGFQKKAKDLFNAEL